jgi:hypothetical protein
MKPTTFAAAMALALLAATSALAEHLVISTMTGRRVEVDIPLDKKVLDLKVMLKDKLDMMPAEQRFFFQGKELDDAKTLAESGLVADSRINLTIRIPAS